MNLLGAGYYIGGIHKQSHHRGVTGQATNQFTHSYALTPLRILLSDGVIPRHQHPALGVLGGVGEPPLVVHTQ